MSEKMIIIWNEEAYLCEKVVVRNNPKSTNVELEITANGRTWKTNAGETVILPAQDFKMKGE